MYCYKLCGQSHAVSSVNRYQRTCSPQITTAYCDLMCSLSVCGGRWVCGRYKSLKFCEKRTRHVHWHSPLRQDPSIWSGITVATHTWFQTNVFKPKHSHLVPVPTELVRVENYLDNLQCLQYDFGRLEKYCNIDHPLWDIVHHWWPKITFHKCTGAVLLMF